MDFFCKIDIKQALPKSVISTQKKKKNQKNQEKLWKILHAQIFYIYLPVTQYRIKISPKKKKKFNISVYILNKSS